VKEIFLIVLCYLLNATADEAKEWLPHLARRLLKDAAARQPRSVRDRLEEEWLAEMAAIPGKLSPLLYACSIWWRSRKDQIGLQAEGWLTQRSLRGLDVAGSAVFIVVFAPVLGMCFAANWVACRGRPLTTVTYQFRGEPLQLYRFTSSPSIWGRFLRITSLNELPLFFNLLKGDITLVGRLPRNYHCDCVTAQDDIRPGLVDAGEVPAEFGRRFFPSVAHVLKQLYRAVIFVLRGER